MWNDVWIDLYRAIELLEEQSKIRDTAYNNYRLVDSWVETIKKDQLRRKNPDVEIDSIELQRAKASSSRYMNAERNCISAELSYGMAKRRAAKALNILLESVRLKSISDEYDFVFRIIRHEDSNWTKNSHTPYGDTSSYLDIYFAPKSKLDPENELSMFEGENQYRHGHIYIHNYGITYLRRYGRLRGPRNFFKTPLSSVDTPSSY